MTSPNVDVCSHQGIILTRASAGQGVGARVSPTIKTSSSSSSDDEEDEDASMYESSVSRSVMVEVGDVPANSGVNSTAFAKRSSNVSQASTSSTLTRAPRVFITAGNCPIIT